MKAVIITNENEFNEVRRRIGEDYLRIGWLPQMSVRETAVGISTRNRGTIGCAQAQRERGTTLLSFTEYMNT